MRVDFRLIVSEKSENFYILESHHAICFIADEGLFVPITLLTFHCPTSLLSADLLFIIMLETEQIFSAAIVKKKIAQISLLVNESAKTTALLCG